MASNGLLSRAKNGKCRMCHRTRCTNKYVIDVGEVRHGFATGHIWECINEEECELVAENRINDKTRIDRGVLKIAKKQGRTKSYFWIS